MNAAPSSGAIVVKLGGSTLGAHDTSLADIAALARQGRRVVVVHGGGALTTEWLERLGVETEFSNGLRKTTAAALDTTIAVLAGVVNKRLVEQFTSLGAQALGISGADAGIVRSPLSERGLGFVGEMPVCNAAPLAALLDAGFLPIMAPIGLSTSDQLININADAVAGAVSVALEAEALVMLTDTDGVLDGEQRPIATIDAEQAEALQAARVVAGGMLPKLAAGRAAAAGGAAARIVDGRAAGAVPAALRGERGTRVL
ncbi:MAG: acetylglutamate kinase [Chloroflexi bacterium]|nr:acetylglutamate kinase [Chloroflexota bacterium]